MKKHLLSILLVLSASLSPAFAGSQFNLINGGGVAACLDPDEHFAPVLFDSSWNRCRTFGGWTTEPLIPDGGLVQHFSIVDRDDRPILDGSLCVTLALEPTETPARRFTWTLTAKQNFSGRSLCLDWSLPCSVYAVSTDHPGVDLGAKSIAFPVSFGETMLGGAMTDTIKLRHPRREAIRITLERPVWCMVQDNRKWNGKDFSMRITINDGQLKAGETYQFSLETRGIDAIGCNPDGYRIRANDEWVPVKDTTEVKAGTALDFSAAGWIDAPAGKHGRVIRQGDHFEFEKKPGVKQRFYGVNLCFTANYMSEADAEELCTRLSRLGYNALRIHHYERDLCDPKDGTTIRPEKMAELDNLLNACIRHGLYLTTDLFVSRQVPWRACGIDRNGCVPMGVYKELVLFHDGARKNYLDFACQLLGHVNPKTGRRWADEPALAFLALINEGNPGNHGYGFMRDLPEAKAAWTAWLEEHKAKDPAVYAAMTDKVPDNCWENSPQNCAYSLFLTDVEIAFAEKMTRFIRDEVKSSVLLTDLSCWKNPIQYQLVRTRYDYVDDHFYVDHPHFLEKSWQLPSKCPNANPACGPNAGFEGVAKHRLLDRPFTITEFNYSGPGQFRGVGGMMLGAQAALQEYDGIWRFAWSHNAEGLLKPQAMSYFDVARDPLQRATERAVTMLYLRGDMKPLKRTHTLVFPEGKLRRDFSCGPQADVKEMWFGWHSRFGTLVGEALPEDATGGLFPEVYSRTAEDYRRWAAGTQPGDGQVVLDRENRLFGVNTPRTAGFFAEWGARTVGPLTAALDGRTPAAVWVSALDDAPIAASQRLLLTHVADVQDEGTVYADATKQVLLKWGRLPHLMRRASAKVTLAFADDKPCKVYALAADGRRCGEIPTVRKGKSVSFTVDTARDPDEATCFYEIVR